MRCLIALLPLAAACQVAPVPPDATPGELGQLHFLNGCNSMMFKNGCLYEDDKTTPIHRKLMPAAKETVVLVDGGASVMPVTTDGSVCFAEIFYASDVVIEAHAIGACVVQFFDGGTLVDRLSFTIGEPARVGAAIEGSPLVDAIDLTIAAYMPVTFGLRAFADDGDELVIDTAFTMSVADTSIAQLIDPFAGTPVPTEGGSLGTLEARAMGDTSVQVMHEGVALMQLPVSVH